VRPRSRSGSSQAHPRSGVPLSRSRGARLARRHRGWRRRLFSGPRRSPTWLRTWTGPLHTHPLLTPSPCSRAACSMRSAHSRKHPSYQASQMVQCSTISPDHERNTKRPLQTMQTLEPPGQPLPLGRPCRSSWPSSDAATGSTSGGAGDLQLLQPSVTLLLALRVRLSAGS
jgi:hypothetical protein